jgi:hypothetical protein
MSQGILEAQKKNSARSVRKILRPSPPNRGKNKNGIAKPVRNPTMNSSDTAPNPLPTSNGLTRRSFMKKTALTAGAITLLGHGVGFVDFSGFSSWFCNAPCVGTIANTPFTRYWSLDDNNDEMYFELGVCKCANGHKMNRGTYIVNVMTLAQAEATLEGAIGHGWAEAPLPPKHILAAVVRIIDKQVV